MSMELLLSWFRLTAEDEHHHVSALTVRFEHKCTVYILYNSYDCITMLMAVHVRHWWNQINAFNYNVWFSFLFWFIKIIECTDNKHWKTWKKKKDVSVHDTKADTWRARTAHSKRWPRMMGGAWWHAKIIARDERKKRGKRKKRWNSYAEVTFMSTVHI